MRPKSTNADLPTAYDVKTYIHNEFVKHIDQLKLDIMVSGVSGVEHGLTT